MTTSALSHQPKRIVLPYAIGESDLGININKKRGEGRAGIEGRRAKRADLTARLRASVAAHDLDDLASWLVRGERTESKFPPPPPPLPTTLKRLRERCPDSVVDLVLVATAQEDPQDDTQPWLADFEAAVRLLVAQGHLPEVNVTSVVSRSLSEPDVMAAMSEPLGGKTGAYDTGVVSWGAGSSRIVLALMSAIIDHGLPCWMVTLDPTCEPILGPLGDEGPDPIVSALVRWRLWGALSGLGTPGGPLTQTQLDVVRRLAVRDQQGYVTGTGQAVLGGLTADLCVRQDGAAGLAVRRYVECTYEVLHADEGGDDVLAHAQKLGGDDARYLGGQLAWLLAHPDDEVVAAALQRESGRWLIRPEVLRAVKAGNDIFHRWGTPNAEDSRSIAKVLDGAPWALEEAHLLAGAGLPNAPRRPISTVLAVWAVGLVPLDADGDRHHDSLGSRLVADQLGEGVRGHLRLDQAWADEESGGSGAPTVDLRVVLICNEVTRGNAFEQAQEVRDLVGEGRGCLASVEVTAVECRTLPDGRSYPPGTAAEIVAALREQVDGCALGAVIVIPSGQKSLAAMAISGGRQVAAEHGVPMALRAMEKSPDVAGGSHVWPTLLDGDAALLRAAHDVVANLEFDVAHRLLAMTTHVALAEECRSLGADFGRWTHRGDGSSPGGTELTGQRLDVVAAALERSLANASSQDQEEAAKVRFLVLGKIAIELSVTDHHGRGQVTSFWETELTCADPVRAAAAEVMLVLNHARNKSPLAHPVKKLVAMDERVRTSCWNKGKNPQMESVAAVLDRARSAARTFYDDARSEPSLAERWMTLLSKIEKTETAIGGR